MEIRASAHKPCKLVNTKTGLTIAEGTYTYCARVMEEYLK